MPPRAYRAVNRRPLGDSAERESAIGQALVTAADGVGRRGRFVPSSKKALGLDPAFAEARFFIALAAEQDGDVPKAAALLAENARECPLAAGGGAASRRGDRACPVWARPPPPAAMASADARCLG